MGNDDIGHKGHQYLRIDLLGHERAFFGQRGMMLAVAPLHLECRFECASGLRLVGGTIAFRDST